MNAPDICVQWLSEINRAEHTIRKMMRGVKGARFQALNVAHAILLADRADRRRELARDCAPWFDGSAFNTHQYVHREGEPK